MMKNKERDMTNYELTHEEKFYRYLLRTDASQARIAEALKAKNVNFTLSREPKKSAPK